MNLAISFLLFGEDPPFEKYGFIVAISSAFMGLLKRSKVRVVKKLFEGAFDEKFVIIVLDTLVHLFLALPNLDVAFKRSEAKLLQPLLSDLALNLSFNWHQL